MNIQVLSADEIGTPVESKEIDAFVEKAGESFIKTQKPAGWFSWMKPKGTTLIYIFKYLVFCLDALMAIAEQATPVGKDKKATVLKAVELIYNFISKNNLPIWIIPWASKFKIFVIYTILSVLVDYCVAKYNQGSWKKV